MLFSIVLTLQGDAAAAPGDMWDLSNFVVDVKMTDTSTPPNTINPGDPTYIGQSYVFNIDFKETPQRQLAYTSVSDSPYTTRVLLFQLPAQLRIQNAVDRSPIYYGTGSIVIGWYTISASGLVYVWFDDVLNDGSPTPGKNFIDNYTNVDFWLKITAQLMSGGDGSLDFGNIVVDITPPVNPPPRLTVVKQSEYDPTLERIYYMITITALGDSISGITLTDSPRINGVPIVNVPNSAFYGFRYSINGSTNFMPMNVNWLSGLFTFLFDPNLTLGPTDYITVRYYLDIPTLIDNNAAILGPLGQDKLSYDFEIDNLVSAGGGGLNDNDNTKDHVKKTFPISKSGVYTDSPPQITWTITIGENSATSNTRLNGGLIRDTLGPDMFLPAPSAIDIRMYDRGSGASYTSSDAADPAFGAVFSPGPPGGSLNNAFTITVPETAFGDIYKMEIIYTVPLLNPPSTAPGRPPTVYENTVNYDDHETVGRVPFNPPPVPITKTTSGICGGFLLPGGTRNDYYVDYKIDLTIPAGNVGQSFYIYDTLGINPGGSGVPNTPVNFTLTSSEPTLQYTTPQVSGNTWRVYLGTNTPGSIYTWSYPHAVDITVTYRIVLNAQTVNTLKGNSSAQLSNAVYLINSTRSENPVLSGSNQNSAGGKNVNDLWPIFKTGRATENPALFNYTVIINNASTGNSSSLLGGKNPFFTDNFDSRLQYVPGSFYVVDTANPNAFYAPPAGSDVTPGTNSFSISLNTLQRYTGVPVSAGGTGTPTGSNPADPAWYTARRNFQLHYQMIIKDAFLEAAQTDLKNNSWITVNPGANQCTFDNSVTQNYNPEQISKTVTTDGSSTAHVEIIINPDGGFIFAESGSPGPAQITARDELTNLMVYLDQITVFTETKVGDHWDGVWKPQPITYNDHALWSVNVVSQDVIDFVLPNQQPIKIVYDALVTLPQGMPGSIGNKMSIFGVTGEDGEDNYLVSDTSAGATADTLKLRLFKQDSVNDINLPGAKFTLYLADLESPGSPPFGITNPPLNVNGINFYPLVANQVTNNFGLAVFDDSRINTTFEFLFLLVETDMPPGYTPDAQNPNPYENYTFFTIKPDINLSLLAAAQSQLGSAIIVNQISDYITVGNIPDPGLPGSLRIWKLFTGLDITDPHYQQQLQNFRITVTDPLGVQHNFNLAQAMDRNGIVLENITAGTYFIQEANADAVDGYNWRSNPQLPIRMNITPNTTRESVVQINNIYTIPAVPLPPGVIDLPESLVVWKDIRGLTDAQIQQNLQNFRIIITGPDGFNESVGLSDAIKGVTFPNVKEGTYFFSEVNANVPGFSFSSVPPLPFRRYIMPTTSGAVTINISNIYTEPSPASGDTRSIVIPIVLLSAGIICIAGAEVFRRRNKKKKEQ